VSAVSRVTPKGWLQYEDAVATARVTPIEWVQTAAGGGVSMPTLSAPTYAPGSLTSSGWIPQVTAT